MKNVITFICLACFLSTASIVNAQESAKDFKKRSPIYDYSETHLNNVDTIPDFASKSRKIKITGTIYQEDGVTPAQGVMLFIEQADEDGNFVLKRENKKRYVHHRGWIRTDKDGKYTFYTFVPGKYELSDDLQQIFPILKEPNKPEYKIETFLFDDDPQLTASCRAKVLETNPNRILKFNKEEGLFVGKRDIVLGKENAEY